MGYMPTNRKEVHYKIKEKLMSSKKVKIWVDPKNENRSVIAKGVNQYPNIFFALGLMLMLFALGMIPFVDHNEPNQSRSILPEIEVLKYK